MNEEERHGAEQRAGDLTEALRATQNGWPFLLVEVERQIEQLTRDLVNANNEETRGRIKALAWIKELPETLTDERDRLIAALSEQDAA